MTGSTPSDLAVTFRSVDRRLREALDGTPATDPAVAGLVAQLRAAVASAASTMGVAGGGDDLAATANAVAGRIDRVPADEWDDAHLESLRASALDVGRVLRAIAEQTEHASSSSPLSASLRSAPTRFARQCVGPRCGAPAKPDAPGPSSPSSSPLERSCPRWRPPSAGSADMNVGAGSAVDVEGL